MGLAHALRSECAAVFILYGTILDIGQIVKADQGSRQAGLCPCGSDRGTEQPGGDRRGFSGGGYKSGWDHLHQTQSHPSREGTGTDHGAAFFLLDSISFENVVRQSSHADVIDILPGAMPDVIRRLSQRVTQPLIASGLLTDKRDVCGALAAGAVAVSTTSEELWEA